MSRAIRFCFRAAAVLAADLALAGCHGATNPPVQWSQLFSDQPGALISVWGSSASDVWAVGGDAGDGKGPMALHFDGTAWTRRVTGDSVMGDKRDLWWVFGFVGGPGAQLPEETVFMGGAGGAILRYANGTFTAEKTPVTAATVYGIWGAAPDDLWAVGGGGCQPGTPFIWHYDGHSDGNSWLPDPRAPDLSKLKNVGHVFKVWGSSASDVWFVGDAGLILHFDGKSFTQTPPLTDQTLFTVAGASGRAYAVGGDGVILENDGSAWQLVQQSGAQMNGVCARALPAGDVVFAAGVNAGVMRRDPSGWVADQGAEQSGIAADYDFDFHGCWIDPDGGAWFVGGQLSSCPLVKGVLQYRGSATIPGGGYQTVQ